MCRKLKCDASNFADIFLNSHDITTALLQTGAAEHMRAHIRSRVQLERRLQLFEGEHAARQGLGVNAFCVGGSTEHILC